MGLYSISFIFKALLGVLILECNEEDTVLRTLWLERNKGQYKDKTFSSCTTRFDILWAFETKLFYSKESHYRYQEKMPNLYRV